MKHYIHLLVILLFVLMGSENTMAQKYSTTEQARWKKHVAQTNIIRDDWGIPHIYGKSDADAVFGLMYAQCEENFPQIEKNYLEMLGRRAEAEGNVALFDDLMMRLIQDSAEAIRDYNNSPMWFKKLLQAHADGINYYLFKHPQVQPIAIHYFKPWYHLMWTDGSVSPTRTGGIKKKDVSGFYANEQDLASVQSTYSPNSEFFNEDPFDMEEKTLKGSNGFAIAPIHSSTGNAMLYINPHVPFYFRSEMHMVSEEGLNAYGAVTWGQFFIYQGFNERVGWMHTSSYADVADVYQEKIVRRGKEWFYEYEKSLRPISQKTIQIKVVEKNNITNRVFATYRTHHGPIMGKRILNDNTITWLSLRENNRSLNALIECWTRTKAKNLKQYQAAMSYLSNNSNNTVYADADGNIAYWHGNFMPKRDTQYNFEYPVDGSIKNTEWKGVHQLSEIVQSINPSNGWLQNCNATPYSVAGAQSPLSKNYPAYMAPDGQNARALNALRMLENIPKISLDELINIGYNKRLMAFDILLPSFFEYVNKIQLNEEEQKAIQLLKNWNHEADTHSIATTLAIEWGTRWANEIPPASTEESATNAIEKYRRMIEDVSEHRKLQLLNATINDLKKTYGKWEIAWGNINRYQRVNPGEVFDDNTPSIAVAQTSSKWGQLPSFESRRFENTKNRYGYSGNSFVAAVSFGKKLEAKTIITGGQSRWASSKHFTDQAKQFIAGDLKNIYFYKADVLAHKVTSYKPGFER